MSIPAYQFPSLATENEAKRRVIKTAKKGVETEEQRAIRSGKIDDNIKNIYKAIISNLELQISTIITAEAVVRTIEAQLDSDAISFLIATLGKLVNLSRQLGSLINRLADSIKITGNPANPSIDIAKIFSLMDEVDHRYGEFGRTGLSLAFADMIGAFDAEEDGRPPELDGLLEIWEVSNSDNRTALETLQRNEYRYELESVKIPIRKGRYVNPDRVAEIASGAERRTVSGAEYRLLLALKQRGILHGDDFTSVYSGASGSSGSIGSSEDSGSTYYVEESDSDDDTASSASSGLQLGALMRGDLAGYGLSGGAVYSIPLQPKRVLNMASGYAYPLRYY